VQNVPFNMIGGDSRFVHRCVSVVKNSASHHMFSTKFADTDTDMNISKRKRGTSLINSGRPARFALAGLTCQLSCNL